MGKIIRTKSLWGYSIMLGVCSVFISANLNILFACKTMEGIDVPHLTPNQRVWEMLDFNLFERMTSGLLKTALLLTMVFLCVALSYLVENQADNLATLSLIGANKKYITIVFFRALLIPLMIAIFLGAIIGMCLSHVFSWVYFAGFQVPSHGFNPSLHVLCIPYTMGLLIAAMILAMFVSLRKLLAIHPLGLASGRFQDLSRISYLRIVCGLVMIVITVWYMFTVKTTSDEDVDNQLPKLMALEILSVFLLIPLILKLVMPIVFYLSSKVFPITGLLAKRYFSARLRRFVSIASPIILCLMFSASLFQAISGTAELNRMLFLNENISLTAVATDISPHNPAMLLRYHNTRYLGKNVAATPIREDGRWIDKAHIDGIPSILEVNPVSFLRTMHAHVTAGDITHVHGMNFASTNDQNKVGEIIHMIDPSGKNIDAHIVATISTTNDLISGDLVADYASVPYGFSSQGDPGHRNFLNFHNYDVMYSGITVQQLRDHGIAAISYTQWVTQRITAMWKKTTWEFYINFSPILGICFALVLANSVALSRNSQFIRHISKIIGGSRWQDLRIMFIELTAVFILAIALMPLPPILDMTMLEKYYYKKYDVHLHVAFPYQHITPILLLLIICTVLLPLTMILQKHIRKHIY